MVFGKELVLKGVASLAAVGSLGLGVYYNQDLIFGDKSGEALLKRAGLTCQDNNGCSLGANKKLTIRHTNESNTNSDVEITTLTSSTDQKLMLYRGNQYENYNKSMKFLVEKGDITLTTTTGSGSSITKLEQFETYELKEEDDASAQGGKKYILLRKTDAKTEIKKELGIPTTNDCDLPDSTTTTKNCSDIDEAKLKAINFEGKTDSLPSIENGKKAKLTITKLTSQEADFPLNYKFVLEPSATDGGRITIPTSSSSSFSIKVGEKVELKIKMNGDKFYLGRAWDIASLIKKIGLKDCATSGSVCAFDTQGLNLKQDSDTHEGKSKTNPQPSGSTEGKIKVYTGEEASGYNEGFKFVIEEGDISLNNGGTTPKLEEFETYEITESNSKYYLTRKEKSSEAKRRLLGIPEDNSCNFPTDTSTVECSLDETKLKKIKFEDKGTGDLTIQTGFTGLKLKISKTTDDNKADYPLGYRFVLESNKDITFAGTSKTIKANTNTEFKIKKGTDNKTLTLEKAWTVTTLASKVGLTCTAEDKKCTLNDNNIKVYNDANKKTENGTKPANGGSDKKISYVEDADGYSQGFKFTASQEITLNNGTELKIEASNATYEIKEQTSGNTKSWYLSKKTSSAS